MNRALYAVALSIYPIAAAGCFGLLGMDGVSMLAPVEHDAAPGGDAATDEAVADEAVADAGALPDADEAEGDAGAGIGRFGPGDGVRRSYRGLGNEIWAGPYINSDSAPCLLSSHVFRMDAYAIEQTTGTLYVTVSVDMYWHTEWSTLTFPGLRDGVDGTSAGARYFDLVSRNQGGRLVRMWADLGVSGFVSWQSEELPADKGILRPAVAHLGPRRLVVLQVMPDGRGVDFIEMKEGLWQTWQHGSDTPLTSGLDAVTVQTGPASYRAYFVSRNADNHAVIASFDGDRDELSPFVEIGGDPETGVAETPAIVSYGLAAGQLDVFVVALDRTIWKRSFDGPLEDSAFVPLHLEPKADDHAYGEIEVSTAPYGGDVMYLTLLRRNWLSGTLEFNSIQVWRE